MTDAEIEEKFRSLTRRQLLAMQTDNLPRQLWALESLPQAGVLIATFWADDDPTGGFCCEWSVKQQGATKTFTPRQSLVGTARAALRGCPDSTAQSPFPETSSRGPGFSRRSQKTHGGGQTKTSGRHSPDERRPPATERHLDSLRKSGGQRKPPAEAERVALLACDMDGRTFIDQQDRWTTTWRCGATTTP
jgi:hypothetical protein